MQDASVQIAVLVVVIVAAVAVLAWWLARRRTSRQLRERFGPEYQRAVEQLGDQRKAENELAKRQKRVEKLELRTLPAEERRRFAGLWQTIQSVFVDNPGAAVTEAHRLVTEVMRARGYPTEDIAQRQADLSVEVPAVVDDYRAARDIAERHEHGKASTEDLRQAMVHYRALFHSLLAAGEPDPAKLPGSTPEAVAAREREAAAAREREPALQQAGRR